MLLGAITVSATLAIPTAMAAALILGLGGCVFHSGLAGNFCIGFGTVLLRAVLGPFKTFRGGLGFESFGCNRLRSLVRSFFDRGFDARNRARIRSCRTSSATP